jgi:murein L,D-transpeptidase YcbB/YkuD
MRNATSAHRFHRLAAAVLAALAVAAGTVSTTAAATPAAAAQGAAAAEAPSAAPGLEIVVNVPAGEMAVFEGDGFVRIYPITVGTRAHPTPVGEYTLTKAVWNPWWHPPKSRWARGKKPQPPGPTNSMGRAKLYFKPLYFIHGTAETEALGRPASHGCVRMSNTDVIDLARLVHRHATPDLDPATLDALAADPKATREIPLERPVTLRIVYERVEWAGDELVIHPDVYRRVSRRDLESQVAAALAERGETVDAALVARQLEGMHRDGGRIPLARFRGEAVTGATTATAAER